MQKSLTTEEFIKRAKEKHGDKYDYSSTIYNGYDYKLKIICPTHGVFEQRAFVHLKGSGCPICASKKVGNEQRKTTERFIKEAKAIHGDRYDYSKTNYITAKAMVTVICPIHGEFQVKPNNHLSGCNCPKCVKTSYKKKVCGVGINDLNESVFRGNNAYNHWSGMIRRCYDVKVHKLSPNYSDCSVCDEWKHLSKFKEWFDQHYVDGWQLDKDILVKGNKVYSPSTCCFVPLEINSLLTSAKRMRGKNPIGVIEIKNKKGIRYAASVRTLDKRVRKYFCNKEDAFNFYKNEKEKNIRRVADKWKDQLEPSVYEALYNYKVEITD